MQRAPHSHFSSRSRRTKEKKNGEQGTETARKNRAEERAGPLQRGQHHFGGDDR